MLFGQYKIFSFPWESFSKVHKGLEIGQSVQIWNFEKYSKGNEWTSPPYVIHKVLETKSTPNIFITHYAQFCPQLLLNTILLFFQKQCITQNANLLFHLSFLLKSQLDFLIDCKYILNGNISCFHQLHCVVIDRSQSLFTIRALLCGTMSIIEQTNMSGDEKKVKYQKTWKTSSRDI